MGAQLTSIETPLAEVLGVRVSQVTRDSQNYRPVCLFVADQYKQHFSADIREFMPGFIVLSNNDDIVAVAGYRLACDDSLFLEQYLADPVDSILAGHFGCPVSRNEIVEVGQLAVSNPRLLNPLFIGLAAKLDRWGLNYLVCTGTRCLNRCLTKAGIRPDKIGTASPELLTSSTSDWGSYYDHKPDVLVGCINEGLAHLRSVAGMQPAPDIATACMEARL